MRSRGVKLDNLQLLQFDCTYNMNQNRKSNRKLSTVNTRSLPYKTAELLQHVFEEQIDLCVITDTWLRSDGDDAIRGELCQDGYVLMMFPE